MRNKWESNAYQYEITNLFLNEPCGDYISHWKIINWNRYQKQFLEKQLCLRTIIFILLAMINIICSSICKISSVALSIFFYMWRHKKWGRQLSSLFTWTPSSWSNNYFYNIAATFQTHWKKCLTHLGKEEMLRLTLKHKEL